MKKNCIMDHNSLNPKLRVFTIVILCLFLSCNLGDCEPNNPNGDSDQCYGYTQQGNSCQRTTTDTSGYCWEHE